MLSKERGLLQVAILATRETIQGQGASLRAPIRSGPAKRPLSAAGTAKRLLRAVRGKAKVLAVCRSTDSVCRP